VASTEELSLTAVKFEILLPSRFALQSMRPSRLYKVLHKDEAIKKYPRECYASRHQVQIAKAASTRSWSFPLHNQPASSEIKFSTKPSTHPTIKVGKDSLGI